MATLPAPDIGVTLPPPQSDGGTTLYPVSLLINATTQFPTPGATYSQVIFYQTPANGTFKAAPLFFPALSGFTDKLVSANTAYAPGYTSLTYNITAPVQETVVVEEIIEAEQETAVVEESTEVEPLRVSVHPVIYIIPLTINLTYTS